MKTHNNPVRDLKFSDVREERMRAVQRALDVQKVDFGNDQAVEAAYNDIAGMGVWDSFVDLAWNGGEKRKALDAIARAVLWGPANAWLSGDMNRVLPKRLQGWDCATVQDALLDAISEQGQKTLMAAYESTDDATHFRPNTHTQIDNLLRISLSNEEAEALLGRGGTDYAATWRGMREEARVAAAHAKEAEFLENGGSDHRAAQTWEKAGAVLAGVGRYQQAAEAYSKAVKVWQRIALPLEAENALRKEAGSWEKAGRGDLAFACKAQQANILVRHGFPEKAPQLQPAPLVSLPRELFARVTNRLDVESLRALALANKPLRANPDLNAARVGAEAIAAMDRREGIGPFSKGLSAIMALKEPHRSRWLQALAWKLDHLPNSDRLAAREQFFDASARLTPDDRWSVLGIVAFNAQSDFRSSTYDAFWKKCFDSIQQNHPTALFELARSFSSDSGNEAQRQEHFDAILSATCALRSTDTRKANALGCLAFCIRLLPKQNQRKAFDDLLSATVSLDDGNWTKSWALGTLAQSMDEHLSDQWPGPQTFQVVLQAILKSTEPNRLRALNMIARNMRHLPPKDQPAACMAILPAVVESSIDDDDWMHSWNELGALTSLVEVFGHLTNEDFRQALHAILPSVVDRYRREPDHLAAALLIKVLELSERLSDHGFAPVSQIIRQAAQELKDSDAGRTRDERIRAKVLRALEVAQRSA